MEKDLSPYNCSECLNNVFTVLVSDFADRMVLTCAECNHSVRIIENAGELVFNEMD